MVLGSLKCNPWEQGDVVAQRGIVLRSNEVDELTIVPRSHCAIQSSKIVQLVIATEQRDC